MTQSTPTASFLLVDILYSNSTNTPSSNVSYSHNKTSLLSNTTTYSADLYEVPLGIIVLLSCCYGAVSLLSVVGNLMVLWIVVTSRRMQTVTNFFIANLAVADISIGIFSIPFQFQAALLQRWVLPRFMCSFCPFIQVVSVTVSIFTLTAISIDRYRAVTQPLKARCCSKFNAKVLTITIWILSIAIAVPNLIALRVETLKDPQSKTLIRLFCTNVGMDHLSWQVYNHVLVCLQYFLPLFIVCYTYGRIWRVLRSNCTPGNAEGARDAAILRNKQRVTKMMLIVVATFALCWLPYQMYNVLQDIFPQINQYRYINVIWFCSHWLAMSNSCYNPFIYAIYSEKFGAEFRQRMRCICSSMDDSGNHNESASIKEPTVSMVNGTYLTRSYTWRSATTSSRAVS